MPLDPVARWAVAAGCAALLGCRRRRGANPIPKPNGRPAKNPALDARTGAFEAVVPDDQGRPWVIVRGREASLADSTDNGTSTGLVRGTEAVLHRRGRPVLAFVAPQITADRRRRIVSGSGRVRVRSLAPGQVATIEADRMQWDDTRELLSGDGHVLLLQDANARVPAERFRTDARLSRIELDFGSEPAAGRL
jgi:hypothetical protein